MGAKVQVLVPLENVSRGGGFRDVKAKYAEKTIGICMACRRPRRHRTRTASTTTSFSTHCLEPYVNKEQFVHKVECANKRGRRHQHPPAVNKVSRGDVI